MTAVLVFNKERFKFLKTPWKEKNAKTAERRFEKSQ